MSSVSNIQPVLPLSGPPQVPSGGGVEGYGEERSPWLAEDVYSGGKEAWRNQATTAPDPGATCRCGNCPACAAKAYASQAQQGNGVQQANKEDQSVVGGDDGDKKERGLTPSTEPKGVDGEVLSQQEQARLAELKKVDLKVRAHEQAHVAAAGGLVRRGVSLSYEKGADGRRYAVSGEVSIDTSRESDPADTIAKMRTVRSAALAPADPSPQDRKVAAAATAKMTTAMGELRLARTSEQDGDSVVRQAAEKKGQGEDPVESGAPQVNEISPQRNRMIQHYAASGSAQLKSLSVTA